MKERTICGWSGVQALEDAASESYVVVRMRRSVQKRQNENTELVHVMLSFNLAVYHSLMPLPAFRMEGQIIIETNGMVHQMESWE